jgi:hypothetical protein
MRQPVLVHTPVNGLARLQKRTLEVGHVVGFTVMVGDRSCPML